MSQTLSGSQPSVPASDTALPWLGDSGDGTYRNPVLYADYSDPDAIRVGDDYWLVASSFCSVPGLPILHSKDLVNWTLVNHALPVLVPKDHYATPRHGCGVWAPAVRHHAGKFWIFYPDPDFGIYVLTATDPRGEWSTPHLLIGGKGLIDPCPFWDEDGQAYLIHGWARSRSGISNRLTLHRMSPDGMRLLDTGTVVVAGDEMVGWHTIEGPKLYRRGKYYYIFAPAGGVAEGYQAVFRSENLWGPYESHVTLAQGSTAVNGPHQGAWIQTAQGEHWFLHFQQLPAYGRVVHLQPMAWGADGWPTMGRQAAPNSVGEPVLTHRMPGGRRCKAVGPATSDSFASGTFGLQWQWQANPEPGWVIPAERSGLLRLQCVPLPATGSLWMAANLLTQKFPAPSFRASTAVRLPDCKADESAGLVLFGYDYAWIGLRRHSGDCRVVLVSCHSAQKGGKEQENFSTPISTDKIHVRVDVHAGAHCYFSYSLDGNEFVLAGSPFRASSSMWVGAKVGLFASSGYGARLRRYAEFEPFTITPLTTPA